MDDAEFIELPVFDAEEACPYLPDRVARLPLRLPASRLSGPQFDRLMAQGDRRSGSFLYRPACPACQACEPIRLPVAAFHPRATQRRTWRAGNRLLTVRIAPPAVDAERVFLFNKHRFLRGLATDDTITSAAEYAGFLANSCCESLELAYYHCDELVAVAIADRGQECLSAVYCYFDPEFRGVSLGVYSVLKQVDLCAQWGLRYLYLGYYVDGSPHMVYKAQYRPHEKLIDGNWRRQEN